MSGDLAMAPHEVGFWLVGGAVMAHEVIERVCTRVAPAWASVRNAPLPLGGCEVWIETADPRTWIVHHQLARELGLIGWHVDADARRVMVLGWSARRLWDRATLLNVALTQRLADLEPTIDRALTIAEELLGPTGSIADVAAATGRRIALELRWPARLAELDGLDRMSGSRPMQLALAQISGLEAKVARRCEEHVATARLVVYAYAERRQERGVERARHEVMDWALTRLRAEDSGLWVLASRPPAPARGLVERFIAASTPNVPLRELGRA
ncbi:hypothetical protein ACIBG8_37180 [Nonomuraea sp. NPDC050556]|uniref:hypothetical protein n=1 Tax=Nonomuraea sp. NPDC050556 TaxID=3364369 RepID=UPI0037AA6EB4